MALSWPEFLKTIQQRHASLLAFAHEWWAYNAPLVARIRATVPPPARILEVGCGTGVIATLLAAQGYEVVGVDVDPAVIEGAERFASEFGVRCTFKIGDAFRLDEGDGRFDLAYSAGVIEHFDQERGSAMLQEQGRVARTVLAVVPTWFALRNDPLTEASGARRIDMSELKLLLRRAGLRTHGQFGYGIPDDWFSPVYRHAVPGAIQGVLRTYLSYACTIGCFGRKTPQPPK